MSATRLAALLVVAACGPIATPGPFTRENGWAPREERSAPAPFLDEPALTQVSISTTTPDEFGSSTVAHTQVLRRGRVVCDFPSGRSSHHENHAGGENVQVVRVSRDPLRFDVRTMSWDEEIESDDPNDSCTRYELSATGVCRTVLERRCKITCTAKTTLSYRRGTGRVVGAATGDGEPLFGAEVFVAGPPDARGDSNDNAMTDASGAFAITPNIVPHDITVTSGGASEHRRRRAHRPGHRPDDHGDRMQLLRGSLATRRCRNSGGLLR